MALTRVSTFGVNQTLQRDMTRTQASLAQLQLQISSGYKSDTFEGFKGQVEQFTDLTAKISKAKQYQQNNEITISRFNTMGAALDAIVQTADEIEDLLVLRRNPAVGSDLAFSQQLEAKKQQLIQQLNINTEGRYLFAGTATDVQPVLLNPPLPVELGTPDDSYYQGSKQSVVVNPQDNRQFDTPVRADDPAFQKIFAAVFKAFDADSLNSDDGLVDAVNLVQSGIRETLALKASLDSATLDVKSINEQHQTLQLYWQGVSEQISKTDILAASTEVSIDQAVLTATFQIFARISSLRLSDYF